MNRNADGRDKGDEVCPREVQMQGHQPSHPVPSAKEEAVGVIPDTMAPESIQIEG